MLFKLNFNGLKPTGTFLQELDPEPESEPEPVKKIPVLGEKWTGSVTLPGGAIYQGVWPIGACCALLVVIDYTPEPVQELAAK